ncbi:MAG TPA: acyltransferase [Anaerolineales bacterium]|nr:acyltransferase [Anaerolineales bacterium]
MPRRLLLLNGLAILGVILFHSGGWGFTAMFAWAHRYMPVASPNYDQMGSAAYYGLRLIEQLVTFSIPAFLVVSGFFASFAAAGSASDGIGGGWRRIMPRLKELLPPYLIWSILLLAGISLQGRSFSAAEWLVSLMTGATNPAYYFVPLLVQLYLLAPLMAPLARSSPRALLIVLGLVQLGVYGLQYANLIAPEGSAVYRLSALLPKWLFIVHIFWFALGMVLGSHAPRFRETLKRWRPWLGAAALAGFIGGAVEWEALLRLSGRPWLENRTTFVDGFYALAFIFWFIASSETGAAVGRGLAFLGSRSYGIYLVHSPVMEVFARGFYHLAPWILSQQLLLQPILIVFGMSVPLVMMELPRRTALRPAYAYLFG